MLSDGKELSLDSDSEMKQSDHSQRQVKQIDDLPDDVLLEIFDFYVDTRNLLYKNIWEIEGLAIAGSCCGRWRSLVLGSPRRLNLQLYCSPRTPTKNKLDVWPALPLVIANGMHRLMISSDTNNAIAALWQSNRVCQVDLCGLTEREFEEALASMQVPFPELTELRLSPSSHRQTMPVISDSFLGGSAPCLRHFELLGISFPGLPKLLLSATHLVDLNLLHIPHSWYISAKAMVALLFVLSSLESFSLHFRPSQSHRDRESRSLSPSKHFILCALEAFSFKGFTEYLEELVTHTPQLDYMHITFHDQAHFDCPRLAQFINRTPTLTARNKVDVQFDSSSFSVELTRVAPQSPPRPFEIVAWKERDGQLSSITQSFTSFLPRHHLFTVEDLTVSSTVDITHEFPGLLSPRTHDGFNSYFHLPR